jgi:hypothetical protein
MAMINYGYIHEEISHGDLLFGASNFGTKLFENRDLRGFIPQPQEIQTLKYFDSYGCVTFMILKMICTMIFRKYGIRLNINERATIVASGTIPLKGNTFSNVIQSLIDDGFLFQEEYPIDFEMKSVNEYFKPLSKEQKLKMKENSKILSIQKAWINTDPDSVYEALEKGPVGVAWYIGKPNKDGTYPRYNVKANHGITICGADYGRYFYAADSLGGSPYIKTLVWNSKFDAAILLDPTLNNMTKFEIAKQENGKGYAIIGEADGEIEFANICGFLGIPLPIKDGKPEWSRVEHKHTYKHIE